MRAAARVPGLVWASAPCHRRLTLVAAVILTQREIRELLSMGECIERMTEALVALARGEATSPLRWGVRLEGGAILGMMPAAIASPAALGLKVVAVFPGNHGTALDSHQGLVVLFDAETGAPRAILD